MEMNANLVADLVENSDEMRDLRALVSELKDAAAAAQELLGQLRWYNPPPSTDRKMAETIERLRALRIKADRI